MSVVKTTPWYETKDEYTLDFSECRSFFLRFSWPVPTGNAYNENVA